METLKKILLQIKDLAVGLLFVALVCGFVLMIAGLMFYFRPQDYVGADAAFPQNPHSPDTALGVRLWLLSIKIILGSGAAIFVARKLESWVKNRKPKDAAPSA